MAYCSKKCLLEVETVRYQCQSDGAKMSGLRCPGPKCLDTFSCSGW